MMRLRRLLPAIAALAFATSDADAATHYGDIYLLMGQSNMSGRGKLDELTPAERMPAENVWLYANDEQWKPAADPVDDAAGQKDDVSKDTIAAVGPGLFFARALHPTAKRPVALVACAKGGTSIRLWQPASAMARDSLYGSCLARAREAEQSGRIKGVLWYQGESDAEDQADAGAWAARFTGMIAALRHDLRQPRLPVVFVRLADGPPPSDVGKHRFWPQVLAEQDSVRIDCARRVSAGGLPLGKDQLHLTTESQRRLGPIMARAMLALQAERGCGGARR